MFERPDLGRRLQLPGPYLRAVLDAHWRGVTEFLILQRDQLAPRNAWPGEIIYVAPTMDEATDLLFGHFSLAKVAQPVHTMQPDQRDRGEFDLEQVRLQHLGMIRRCPGGSGVTAEHIGHYDRRAMYAAMGGLDKGAPQCALVVKTGERKGYGNLGFTIDPSSSPTLATIPKVLGLDLAVAISECGHSDRIALVPASRELVTNPRQQVIEVDCSIEQLAPAISTSWIPDVHAQPDDSRQQTPLAACADGPDFDGLRSALDNPWQSCSFTSLSPDDFTSVLSDQMTIVVRCKRSGTGSRQLIFVNGVSGANGGF